MLNINIFTKHAGTFPDNLTGDIHYFVTFILVFLFSVSFWLFLEWRQRGHGRVAVSVCKLWLFALSVLCFISIVKTVKLQNNAMNACIIPAFLLLYGYFFFFNTDVMMYCKWLPLNIFSITESQNRCCGQSINKVSYNDILTFSLEDLLFHLMPDSCLCIGCRWSIRHKQHKWPTLLKAFLPVRWRDRVAVQLGLCSSLPLTMASVAEWIVFKLGAD